MELRKLTNQEYLKAAQLSMYAFQYTLTEKALETALQKMDKHTILSIWDEDELASKLHILSLKVNVNGQQWNMGGIAGVATYPEYRRKGYVKKLLTAALSEMNQNKQFLSFLHPFDISFYRKFGWEVLTDVKKITIEKANLSPIGRPSGTIIRYKKESHRLEFEKIYQAFSTFYSGPLIRTSDWWKNSVYSDEQIAVYYDGEGNGQGYLLYSVKDNIMTVEEYVWLNYEARSQLWNFICQHDSMIDRAIINTSVHDPFPYLLQQPKQKIEIIPYFMARIVNVKEVLARYNFLHTEQSLSLSINDEFAPWNNITYRLGEDEGDDPVLEMNINALTAILTGYKRPMELYEMNFIRGNRDTASALEEKIPPLKTYFMDFF
ncbi:GNAT family N-acetyltransferase [Bacillaceae bacterium Marseille-Q3522]|nr:GNAT family N-acetyltransferase [Bacillaceae bacterium Marseille-Q3522]